MFWMMIVGRGIAGFGAGGECVLNLKVAAMLIDTGKRISYLWNGFSRSIRRNALFSSQKRNASCC